MPEYSLIHIVAHKYRKGGTFVRDKDEELIDYPTLCWSGRSPVQGRSIDDLVKPLTKEEYESKGHYDFRLLNEGTEPFEVLEDFYYFEPTHRSGFSLDGGYSSGADWEIDMIGVGDVLQDAVDAMYKDFLPLFEEAERVEAEKGWKSENDPIALIVQSPAVLSFTSSYSYDGEYDCDTEYVGLLNTKMLGQMIRDTAKEAQVKADVERRMSL
jgi:hypothetical protein